MNGAVPNEIPEDIRVELRKFSRRRPLTCLECGYVGLMGVQRSTCPWYFSWWVVIPLLLTGIGIIPAILILAGKASSTKDFVVCPRCKKLLGPV
jgi:hypothetical protein